MAAVWPISVPGIEPQQPLGSGGFGQVWLAQQTAFERRVAVKIAHRPFATEDDRRRFERECKALGRLSGHPNIVEVHTSGVSEGLPYLVLEFVDGGTLAEHGPRLGEARLRIVADQLCQAVAAAHAVGVLHRDLKPANVFLRQDGQVALGDFGIARVGDDNNTTAAGVTASMAFAAPEILDGQPPTPAADVYGIGITIAAAAMGRSPFVTEDSPNLEAVVARVVSGLLPDLGPYGLSPPFGAWIRRATARDPAQRPPSVDELRHELHLLPAISAPETVVAPSVGAPAPAARPELNRIVPNGRIAGDNRPKAPRGPAIAAGLGLAAIVLVVGWFLLRPEREPRSTAVDTPSTIESPITTPSTTGPDVTAGASSTVSQVPLAPLALPLTGPEISELTEIPFDFNGVDPLLGPADSPQFCDQRPDISGLIETTAGIYPIDPTTDASLRQVVQRAHRFETPDQASNFIRTYTTFECTSWTDDELFADFEAELSATVVAPTLAVGEEISQVDQRTTTPIGVDIWSRTVLVRSGRDVFKLVYFTLVEDDLEPVTDRLLSRSVETLSY